MKGVVFNLLEGVVRKNHGEDTWDHLLHAAGASGSYTSLGSYPDKEMMSLVHAGSSSLNISPDDMLRWFGRTVLPEFAKQYPHFFQPHKSARSFLLTLNDVIHPEVRKLYPGADVPTFDFDTSSDGTLLMGYTSKRLLCAFGEGLILGSADHFHETVEIY